MNDLNEWIIDLPHLKFIELGECALVGRKDPSCSLVMESVLHWMSYYSDLPNLEYISSNGFSFRYPRSVTLYSKILNDWILKRNS